ncbi:MAG: hypothetical protein KDK78_08660, partial [Chlamydiia bacterium]|nr:hypothetical protein [Chlamydiia bacterium]
MSISISATAYSATKSVPEQQSEDRSSSPSSCEESQLKRAPGQKWSAQELDALLELDDTAETLSAVAENYLAAHPISQRTELGVKLKLAKIRREDGRGAVKTRSPTLTGWSWSAEEVELLRNGLQNGKSTSKIANLYLRRFSEQGRERHTVVNKVRYVREGMRAQ